MWGHLPSALHWRAHYERSGVHKNYNLWKDELKNKWTVRKLTFILKNNYIIKCLIGSETNGKMVICTFGKFSFKRKVGTSEISTRNDFPSLNKDVPKAFQYCTQSPGKEKGVVCKWQIKAMCWIQPKASSHRLALRGGGRVSHGTCLKSSLKIIFKIDNKMLL